MGQYQHLRARRPSETEPAPGSSATEYRAPTVGLEGQIFKIGSTKDAAKFELVKEELGKHFATQSWSDEGNAAMAFETLTKPMYDEPA